MRNYLIYACCFILTLKIEAQTITDIDGNVYNTVIIGTQEWMAENLKAIHFADGTPVLNVTGNANWDTLTSTSQAYCWYYDDSLNYSGTYGALYTWSAAMNGAASTFANPSGIQGICPKGWHLPSPAEWSTMQTYLVTNGYNYDGTVSGNKIGKSLASPDNWITSTNVGAVGNTDYPLYRNMTGFSALPAGFRAYTGLFGSIKGYTYWWTTAEGSQTGANTRYLCYYQSSLGASLDYKKGALSVRCIKDNTTSDPILNKTGKKIIFYDSGLERIYVKCDNTSASFSIFDLQGKTVYKSFTTTDYTDISYLYRGVYFVKVAYVGTVIIDKFIKE